MLQKETIKGYMIKNKEKTCFKCWICVIWSQSYLKIEYSWNILHLECFYQHCLTPWDFCDLWLQGDLYTKTILVTLRCWKFWNYDTDWRCPQSSLICAAYSLMCTVCSVQCMVYSVPLCRTVVYACTHVPLCKTVIYTCTHVPLCNTVHSVPVIGCRAWQTCVVNVRTSPATTIPWRELKFGNV